MIRDEKGLTLIEMLVAMAISVVILGSATVILTVFMHNTTTDAVRDHTQDSARQIVERMSRELRNAATPVNNASPSTVEAGLLEKATSDDIVFEEVSAAGTPPTTDVSNEMQVRYCLGANDTLWRQSTSPSQAYTTVPDTTSCPSTSSGSGGWVTTSQGAPCCIELNTVTNEIGGNTTRPLFTYGPSGWSTIAQINQVAISAYVDDNPGGSPGPTQLTTSIDLRNELSDPVALPAPPTQVKQQTGTYIQLNASPSYDPNGQALSYQWYTGSTCPASGTAFSTSQQPTAGPYASGTQLGFLLVVTDTAGLSSCQPETVTAQ